jgi:signal transduction histidine kinase
VADTFSVVTFSVVADPARSNAAGNAGLGLAIVKSIVGLHGGTITARSTHGEGTSMNIRMPNEE